MAIAKKNASSVGRVLTAAKRGSGAKAGPVVGKRASGRAKAAPARPASKKSSTVDMLKPKVASTKARVASKGGLLDSPPNAAAGNTVNKAKLKKLKLVRDSFTIPKPEYLVLDQLKLRATNLTRPAKKSELLRAGIKALAALSDAAFLAALEQVPAIKTGRPALHTLAN